VLIFGGKNNIRGTTFALILENMIIYPVPTKGYTRYGHSNSNINNQVYLFGGY
jgi:hypothetical protein